MHRHSHSHQHDHEHECQSPLHAAFNNQSDSSNNNGDER